MKAIVQTNYDGINGLEIQTLAEPHVSPISAIVETKFTPVIPYDVLTEEGQLQNLRPTKLPMVIGYGFGGQVREVGQLRDHHLVGQNVISANLSGSNQELINSTMPPLLFRVPKNVELADATTIIGGADAALYATRQMNTDSQDTVIVTGAAGSVGTYLIQLLIHRGATVIAIGHSSNHAFLQTVGANFVLNYDEPLTPQLDQVPHSNKIIDSAGSVNLLDQLSRYYDELTIFSLAVTDYRPLKETQKFAFGNGSVGLKGYHHLLTAMADGSLKAFIQDQYPFTEVKEAQRALKNHHSHGRLLLRYN